MKELGFSHPLGTSCPASSPWVCLPYCLRGGGDNHYSASPAFSLRIPPLAHFLQQPKKPPQQHLFTLLMNMHPAGS